MALFIYLCDMTPLRESLDMWYQDISEYIRIYQAISGYIGYIGIYLDTIYQDISADILEYIRIYQDAMMGLDGFRCAKTESVILLALAL